MMASGSGPDRSPVSSVPADMGERGFEWRLDEGRFSLKPDDADGSLRPSGVAGGFDIVISIKDEI